MMIKRNDAKRVEEVVKENTGINPNDFIKESEEPKITNLKEAAKMIKEYAKRGEHITIVGDYDVDGICATAILEAGLKELGVVPKTRIPRRFSEGYGLNEKIIDEIKGGLLITVDNGIAALKSIKKAKEKGLAVIVTDHHLGVRDENDNLVLPEADITVDEHVYDTDCFKDYCGAVIAYSLVKELLSSTDEINNLLVLASLATICDVMPVINYNRDIVIKGLKLINEGCGPIGLRALMKELNIQMADETSYGFSLGPCINASGRLYDNGADKVLNLLDMQVDDTRLSLLANALKETNERRKELVEKESEIAEKLISTRPIVVFDESFKEGLVGIIAGKLTEKYACPSIVFSDIGNGILKGSGRSIPGIHLRDKLDKISHLLLGYGGHAGAAGLSIKKENLKEFTEAFEAVCGQMPEITDDSFYDLDLGVVDRNTDIESQYRDLSVFAPYGEGNPRPVYHGIFTARDVYKPMGKNRNHFSLYCDGNIKLVGFHLNKKYEELKMPRKLEAIGYMSKDYFNGKWYNKFELIDFEKVE